MSIETVAPSIIVDADCHLTEPADLWTARVPAKYREVVPRVDVHPANGIHHWRIGDRWLHPVGYHSPAGWGQYPPDRPLEFEDCEPGTYDARERLKRMDEFGLAAQILYPNIVGFLAGDFSKLDPEVSVLCVQAYNDFAHEWASEDPRRLFPIAMVPFWDREASVREIERCVSLGFRGVLFANKLEMIGMPSFLDSYWDPIYATAQECGVPINYHIGFSSDEVSLRLGADAVNAARQEPEKARLAAVGRLGQTLMGQATLLGSIVLSGICERFPRLKLVSVETGFGHLPFYLETLDWQWKAYGNESLALLPSEYFRRQCYTTFWFDRVALRLLDCYPENFMFSTDYPHPTSLSPGPCAGTTLMPSQWVEEAFVDIDPWLKERAVFANANQVYNLNLG
jgi:uncharacterized protein